MVLQNLETQSNRVILKMDITHEEHPSLIGKKGYLIKQVMESTNTHVHFPDTNLRAVTVKSNQVSITGEPCNVEKARIMLRALVPFQVIFDVDVSNGQTICMTSPLWKQIEEVLGLDIHFVRNRNIISVIIRCSQRLFPTVRQQILALIELLSQKRGSDLPPVKVAVDIMAQHHNFVKGPKGCNIQAISNRTGAKIVFPNLNTETSEKRRVNIIGNLDCVYMAWQELMSFLPVTVSFDVSESREMNNDYTDFLLDCNICVYSRPKPKYLKNVSVKGPEKFSKQIFQYRQRILNLPAIKFQPDIDDINTAFSFEISNLETPHTPVLRNISDSFHNIKPIIFEAVGYQNASLPKTDSRILPALTYNNLGQNAVNNNYEVVGYHNPPPSNTGSSSHSTIAFKNWGKNSANNNNEAVIKDSEEPCKRSELILRETFSNGDNYLCPDSPLKTQGVNQFEIFEKRLSAHQAIHRQIESTQVPSGLWAGYGFSQSMPAACIKKEIELSSRYSSVSLESNSSSSSEELWNSIVLSDYIDDKIWPNNGESVFSMSNVFDFKRNTSLPTNFDSQGILPRLLYEEGLYNYIDVFLREEIDYAAFLLLNESDLAKLGINYQARMKITCLIRELQDAEMKMKTFDATPGAGRRIGEKLLLTSQF